MFGNQNTPQNHNIPCPECKFPIPVSIMSLVSGQPLQCLNVNCQIELNADISSQGMNALKNFDSAVKQFEEKKRGLGA